MRRVLLYGIRTRRASRSGGSRPHTESQVPRSGPVSRWCCRRGTYTAAARPSHSRRNLFGSIRSFGRTALTDHAPRLQQLAFRKRQPQLGSPPSERGSTELSTSATMSLVGHRLTGAWHCRRSDFHPIPLLPVTSPEGLLGWEAERFTGCRHPGLRRDWKASPTCATIIPQAAGAARKLPAETRRFTGLNQGEIDDNPDKPTAV